MTGQSKQPHREGSHLASADRRTLDAIFHHPAAHNLSWMDALDLLTHLGSAEEKADGKYSLTINGKHIVFHKPHNKQLDAHEISELRHYLASAGISPQNPYGTPPAVEPTSVDVVALIDHHSAKLYRVNLSSDQPAETVKPYDPYHFLHHLHHGDQLRERGQRAPEDLDILRQDRRGFARGRPDRAALSWRRHEQRIAVFDRAIKEGASRRLREDRWAGRCQYVCDDGSGDHRVRKTGPDPWCTSLGDLPGLFCDLFRRIPHDYE